jgi:hypothetical protein
MSKLHQGCPGHRQLTHRLRTDARTHGPVETTDPRNERPFAASPACHGHGGPAGAAEDAKIALVAPASGRGARQGQLIKALGGAKIVLREADAGDRVVRRGQTTGSRSGGEQQMRALGRGLMAVRCCYSSTSPRRARTPRCSPTARAAAHLGA